MAYDGSIDKIVRYGTKASRPTTPNLAPNVLGTYVATDTSEVSYWTGSAWTSWASIAPPLTNPMTTAGDIVVGGSGGTPTRLAAGTNTYVLTMVSGAPAWAAASGGSSATPLTTQSAAYTLVIGDANSIIHHPASDTTARTWTIPANSSVAFATGTMVTFDNATGAGALTIAITTDTLELVGAGTTGSRTIAAGGQATAVKVAPTKWRISGTGLT